MALGYYWFVFALLGQTPIIWHFSTLLLVVANRYNSFTKILLNLILKCITYYL